MRLIMIITVAIVSGCGSAERNKPQKTNEMFFPAGTVMEWVVPFRYPPDKSNYWWDMQESSNLINWTTITTNATGEFYTVTNSKPRMFYRAKGRL